jgi:hypothetical protein
MVEGLLWCLVIIGVAFRPNGIKLLYYPMPFAVANKE